MLRKLVDIGAGKWSSVASRNNGGKVKRTSILAGDNSSKLLERSEKFSPRDASKDNSILFVPSTSKGPVSLNFYNRKKEIERIERENRLLAKRLSEQSSAVLKKKKQDADFSLHKKRKEMLMKMPPPLSLKMSTSKGNLSKSVNEEPPMGNGSSGGDYGTYNGGNVRTPGKGRNTMLSRTHSENHVKHRSVVFKGTTPMNNSPHTHKPDSQNEVNLTDGYDQDQ